MTSKSKVTLTFAGEDKQLNRTFDNVERRADKLQQNFKRFAKGAGIAGAAIGGMAIAGGAALFKLGESFDKAYDTIITGTGATGKALEGLQDSFKTVLASGPDAMGDVATAIADLNTAVGLTGKPLEDLSRQFLDLSRITETDLGGNIKSVTRLFGDWGIAVEDQGEALDKLFVVSQNTGAGITDIADLAVKAGAPFRQLGFTFEETTALIGKWNQEGVNTEILISGMRQAISKLAREGKDIPSTFADVVKSIEETASASDATRIAIELFGAEAGPDMAAAIREGRFDRDELLAWMEDADGAIGRTADATASFGEKWEEFKNKLKVALEPAAIKLFDKLGEFFDWAGPKLENEVIPAMEDFWKSFDAADSVGGKWGDLGEDVANFVDKVTTEGGKVVDFMTDEFWPVFSQGLKDLNESFEDSLPEAEKFFQSLAQLYETLFGDSERDTSEHTRKQEATWNNHFRNMLEGHGNQRDTIYRIGTETVQFLDKWASNIQADWQRIKDFFGRWGRGIASDWQLIKNAWNSAVGNLSVAWRTFTNMMSGTAAAISRALAGVANAIAGPFRDGYFQAVEWANKIPGINIKGPTVQMSGVARNLGAGRRSSGNRTLTPTRSSFVPNRVRHSGGPVTGSRVGQEVPILARAGEHVVTANQMAAMSGRGGGSPVVIRIESGGSRIDDVIVEIIRKSVANRGGSVQAVLG